MNASLLRPVGATAVALAIALALAPKASAAPKAAAASPSPSAAPAALPTASPEPPDVAIPRLEAKLKTNPNDKDSLLEIDGYYLQVGRIPQALAVSQHLLSLGEKTAQVYYFDGLANQQLGRGKETLADFEQAANLEPTNTQILLTLTDLYLRLGRPADAERVAKRATVFNKDDKRAWINYGLVLAQEKKYDDARAQFEVAAKLDPKDANPVVLEARSYIEQSALALAQQDYERALAIDPKDGEALLGKARLLATEHNVKDSIATYEQLLAIVTSDQEKASVVLEEFAVYRAEKMDDQAGATIKRALADYPKEPSVHLTYGDYLSSQKNQAGAIAEWNTALGPNRDNPDALQRLADMSLVQNRPQDAVGYTKRLTELVPTDPGAWLALGQTESYVKQWQASHDAYRRSFELSQSPQALAGIGTVDFQMKNYKECGQVFDVIDAKVPDFLKSNVQMYYVMGNCYKSTGQVAKAKSAFTRLQPFIRPNTQLAADVKRDLQDLNHTDPPKKATPKPSPSPKH